MERGIRLFNSLFEDEQTIVEATKPQNCIRDAQLIAERNDFLFHRFYYKSKMLRRLYPDCIKELSREVWLTKITLQKLIQANGDAILQIKKQAPTVKDLQKKFPWIIWD